MAAGLKIPECDGNERDLVPGEIDSHLISGKCRVSRCRSSVMLSSKVRSHVWDPLEQNEKSLPNLFGNAPCLHGVHGLSYGN